MIHINPNVKYKLTFSEWLIVMKLLEGIRKMPDSRFKKFAIISIYVYMISKQKK